MKPYIRKINYYETDKMGIVHHSNYIRFLEEARCYWMEEIGAPCSMFEKNGYTIPVLGVNITYKKHVTFDDVIEITPYIKEYSSVRITVGYKVIEQKTGETVIIAETKHCFTNYDLKPVSLKKVLKEADEALENDFLANKKK